MTTLTLAYPFYPCATTRRIPHKELAMPALRVAGAACVVALVLFPLAAGAIAFYIIQQAMASSLDHPYRIGPAYVMRQDTALSLTTCPPLNASLYPGAGSCSGTMVFFSWGN